MGFNKEILQAKKLIVDDEPANVRLLEPYLQRGSANQNTYRFDLKCLGYA